MCSPIFAQNGDGSSTDKKNVAKLVREFGEVATNQIRTEMNSFLVELQSDPNAQGYIINYGRDKDIVAREKILRDYFTSRRFDLPRIVIVDGGFENESRTQLWIVPVNAELPTVKPTLNKIDEFGITTDGHMKALLDSFLVELQNHPNKKGYVVITGSAKAVSRREKFMRNYISLRRFDSSRIVFVNNGFNSELKSELWIDL